MRWSSKYSKIGAGARRLTIGNIIELHISGTVLLH